MYEDKLWEKVQGNFRAIYKITSTGAHIHFLNECLSIWNEYDAYDYDADSYPDGYETGDWPSDKKKEGFEFIQTLYCIHKCFEEESRKGNTKYLGMD